MILKMEKDYILKEKLLRVNNFFTEKKDYDKMMRFVNHARTLLGKHNVNVSEYH